MKVPLILLFILCPVVYTDQFKQFETDCILIGKELFRLTLRDGSLRNENWLIAFNLHPYSSEKEFIRRTCLVLKKICIENTASKSQIENYTRLLGYLYSEYFEHLKIGRAILNKKRMEFLESLQLIIEKTNFPVYPLADDKQWNSIKDDVRSLLHHHKYFLENRHINMEEIKEAFQHQDSSKLAEIRLLDIFNIFDVAKNHMIRKLNGEDLTAELVDVSLTCTNDDVSTFTFRLIE